MLERFPNNLPKHRENVIPADSEKKSFEEVSGEGNGTGSASGVGGTAWPWPSDLVVCLGGRGSAGEPMADHTPLRTDGEEGDGHEQKRREGSGTGWRALEGGEQQR